MTDLSNSPPGAKEATAREGPGGVSLRRFELLVTVGILLALLMGALDNFVVLTALSTILVQFGQPNGGTFVVSAYVIASTAAIDFRSAASCSTATSC